MQIAAFRKHRLALAGFLGVTAMAAALASAVTDPATDPWYQDLTLPSFQPPAIAFPIVWTFLYIAMAIAGWRVWMACTERGKHSDHRSMAWLYAAQLTLNAFWSVAFFAANNILLGLLIISALWLTLILWTLKAWRIDWVAALLFVPYILWVSFAAALNGSILALN